jgi:peroxiredoxin
MPGFEGDTVSHNHFYTAQGAGYAMVVRFFSGNNAETKETLAALQRVYEDNSDLVVVAVSRDASPGATRQVVDELGLHYPVIIDEGGQISKQYQVTETPATFVITTHGTVSWVGGARATEDAISAAVHVARRD